MTASSYLGGHLSLNRGVGVNHTAFEEPATEWTAVASMSDLAQDEPVRATAGGVPVVLVRRGEQVFALSATCRHAGGPLDEGKLVDDCVRCPWHGSMFRLTDGKVMRGPAHDGQPAWQVRVEGDQVQVRVGGR
ncbi:MAG: Rieske (2Fe-2S) protein [Acidimicrobiales bacterium]